MTPPRRFVGPLLLAALATGCAAADRLIAPKPEGRILTAAEIAARVSVHLEGITALTAEDVFKAAEDQLEAVALALDGTDTAGLGEDIVYRLLERYRALGYCHVQITAEVSAVRGERGRRVNVRATEGPRVVLGSLRIEGAVHLPPAELSRFYLDRAPRTVPIFGRRYYVQRVLEEAVRSMEESYQAEGYLQVSVRIAAVDFSADESEAHVRVHVGEGPRARIQDLRIVGGVTGTDGTWRETPFTLPDADAEIRAVLDGVGIRPGAVFGKNAQRNAVNAVTELYHERGYPLAVVQVLDPARITPAGALEYSPVVRVREGPVAGIRVVRPQGNSWTPDFVITRETSHLIGETYQGSALREVQQALTRLALFKSVDVKWASTPGHPAWVDVDVVVEESDAIILRSDFGYASTEGLRVAPTVDLPNLLSIGHNVQARAIVSEIRRRVEGKLTSGWTAGLPIRAQAEISWEDKPEPLSRRPSFRMESVRAALTFRRPVISALEGVLGYEIARSRVYDLADGIVLQTQLGTAADAPVPDLQLSAVSVGWVLDGRDDRFNPRVGAYADMLFTAAGGDLRGNVRFERLKGTLAAYTSVWRTTLGVRGSAQSVRYHGTTQFPTLPPPYRQFSGGHDTVRSFGEGELGPRTVDDPTTLGNEGGSVLGGLARGTVNVELRTRVWPAPERPFGVSVLLFGDAGVVWPYGDEARAMVPLGEDKERYRTRPTDIAFALGVGLRFDTPIGPIGVDLGWNPDRFRIPPSRDTGGPRHEDAFAVFVQVGQTF